MSEPDKTFQIAVDVVSDEALARLKAVEETMRKTAVVGAIAGGGLAGPKEDMAQLDGVVNPLVDNIGRLVDALNKAAQAGQNAGKSIQDGLGKAERSSRRMRRMGVLGAQMFVQQAMPFLRPEDDGKRAMHTGDYAANMGGQAVQGAAAGFMAGGLIGAGIGAGVGLTVGWLKTMQEDTARAQAKLEAYNKAVAQAALESRTMMRALNDLATSDQARQTLDQLAEAAARVRDQMELGLLDKDAGTIQLYNLAKAANVAREALDTLNAAELADLQDQLKDDARRSAADARGDADMWLAGFDADRDKRLDREGFEDGLAGKSKSAQKNLLADRLAEAAQHAAALREELESAAVMGDKDLFSAYAEAYKDAQDQADTLQRRLDQLNRSREKDLKGEHYSDKLARIGGMVGAPNLSMAAAEDLLRENNTLMRQQTDAIKSKRPGASVFA